jgi:NAD(P)-dependent dehydrogenase (short-subunit alcohol dehydrogenase family)
MKINLKNNIILVTGATGGIGVETIKVLSEAGATIAIHYNSDEVKALELKKIAGNNSEIFKANLANSEETVGLWNSVVSQYGKIDGLVNNAGVFSPAPIDSGLDNWLESWTKTMDINLTSTGILCKLAISHFKNEGGGCIINISSRAAFRGDDADYLAYAASKAGMVALSRSIARAWGKENIYSFVIAPGFVKTKMAQPYIDEVGEDFIINQLAVNKLTAPEDVAPTILFLLSGKMDHLTGSSIDINGGSYIR